MRTRLALTATLCAATTIVALGRTDALFSPDRFKAHVAFLADDALEGREAGTRGHEIAARYIAAQFAAMDMKPGGPDGSYFEQVPLFESKVTGAAPTLTITTPSGSQTLTQGGATVMRGPLSGGPVRVKAPVVFAGYGITDATLGIDDYQGLDVRGKIVAVLWGFPNGMDSEIGAHLQSKRAQVAGEHGAAAVISIQIPGRGIPWPVVLRIIGDPVTTYVQENGTPFDPSYGLKAYAFIDEKSSTALLAGSSQTFESIIEETKKPNGRPRGFETRAVAEISVETATRRYSSPEVIGVIQGRDRAKNQEYVALMAHADHIGISAEGAADRINNGALDNAAGVATLLEVARAFATGSEPPRRSVLVVANTAEEKGLLGAEYFAHYPSVPSDRIVAAIDLDMPLLLYDFTDVVAFGATHSTLEKEFRKAGADMGITLSPDPMPEQAIFVRSDHYAMVKAGVPAVMLATGMANGGKAAWDKFLSANYHQPSDDLSQPIVWKAGAKFAELNYRVVRALADADARPRWYAKDYFGDLYAPKAKKATK
jgi:hypothetical protein